MNIMPIKVLYVITDLNIGGTEKILFETVKRINKKQYRPFVVALKKWGEYAGKIKNENIEVVSLDIYKYGMLLMPFRLLFSALKLRKLIRKENIKIIHSFLFQANMLGRMLFLLAGRVKVVASIRVMEKQKTWQLYFEKMTAGLCDKVIVNSLALKNYLLEKKVFRPDKIEIIYNGINAADTPDIQQGLKRRELGLALSDIIIGTVARLHKQKGMEYFLQSATIVINSLNFAERTPKFVIIGDGPEMGNLKNLTEKLNINKSVLFTGWKTDALAIVSLFDIFVLPSLWEGTPNAILEAMLLQKPIIMTNTGAANELIDDGINGMLVPSANPVKLAEAVIDLVKNTGKALMLAKNAKEKVTKMFSIDKMITKTEDFYRVIL